MLITFKVEGGFAHFPGLARPVEIDTEALPDAERRDLEAKVRAASVLERNAPGVRGNENRRQYTPDAETYVLTVRQRGRVSESSVEVREPVEVPQMEELLSTLRRYQRERFTNSR